MIVVGDRFTMKSTSEPAELRHPKSGALIARFLPSHSYRVTGLNIDAAMLLIAQERAVEGEPAPKPGESE